MAELTNEEFDFIYARVPRACVDLVIETARGLVLIRRSDPPEVGAWHMPGGGIRMHERLEDATKRIARNELSVEIRMGQIIGYDEYIYEPRKLGEAHSVGFMVRAEITFGSLDSLVKTGDVAEFQELPNPMVSTHKIALEKFWHKREVNR